MKLNSLHNVVAEENFNLELIKSIVDEGGDLNVKNKEGETPLEVLINLLGEKIRYDNTPIIIQRETLSKVEIPNCIDAIKYLIEKNADLNIKNFRGDTIVHKLVPYTQQVNFQLMEFLIEKNADLNIKNSRNETLAHILFSKMEKVNFELMEFLIEKKADLNIKNSREYTPVYNLFQKTQPVLDLNFVKFFDENKINIDAKDLFWGSSYKDSTEVFKLFWKNQLDFDEKDSLNNKTALYNFCKKSESPEELVEHLVGIKLLPNAQWITNHNLLEAFALNEKASIDIMKLLVAHGANINAGDIFLSTPLHYAILYNIPDDKIKYLIENKADLNAPNRYKETPFHNLCRRDENITIDQLIYFVKSNASINALSKKKITPFDYFCRNKNITLNEIEYLINSKANVTAEFNKTILHSLCQNENHNLDMVKCLIENKANVNVNDKYGKSRLFYSLGHKDLNFKLVEYLTLTMEPKTLELEESDISNFPLFTKLDLSVDSIVKDDNSSLAITALLCFKKISREVKKIIPNPIKLIFIKALVVEKIKTVFSKFMIKETLLHGEISKGVKKEENIEKIKTTIKKCLGYK